MPWPPRPRPTPDPPPEPTPPAGPPVELRVARVTSRTAIGSALIAVVAAGLGAVVAGYFSVSTASQQIQASHEDARVQFLRTQQQTTYASFLTDQDALQSTESDLTNTFLSDTPQDGGPLLQKMYDANDKLALDVNNINLIGSANVVRFANQILDAHGDILMRSGMEYDTVSQSKKPLNPADYEAIVIVQDGETINRLIKELTDAARTDLGSGS